MITTITTIKKSSATAAMIRIARNMLSRTKALTVSKGPPSDSGSGEGAGVTASVDAGVMVGSSPGSSATTVAAAGTPGVMNRLSAKPSSPVGVRTCTSRLWIWPSSGRVAS